MNETSEIRFKEQSLKKEMMRRLHESQCSWYEFVLQYLKFQLSSFAD